LKPVISIFFASLVLLTNMSLCVASHYCGGKLVMQEISFGEEKLSCGMAEEEESCGASLPINSLKKVPCCEDQQLFWDVEDRFNPNTKAELLAIPIIEKAIKDLMGFKAIKLFIQPIIKRPDPPGSFLFILNQVFRL
jgi:hypothetical protein